MNGSDDQPSPAAAELPANDAPPAAPPDPVTAATITPPPPPRPPTAPAAAEPAAPVDPAVAQAPDPAASPEPPEPLPEPVPDPIVEPDLSGFVLPIADACVTEFQGHLPGAPRPYRNGIHEGLDLYGWASCTAVTADSPVLAAKAGTVTRADRAYTDLTLEELADAEAAGFQGEAILDRFRGRQVWIDHGGGVVTRYAHLGAVAAGIEVGDEVRAGQVIAFAGESGTPESVLAPGTDIHLHFEIRVDGAYLGAGLDPFAARALYLKALGTAQNGAAAPGGP